MPTSAYAVPIRPSTCSRPSGAKDRRADGQQPDGNQQNRPGLERRRPALAPAETGQTHILLQQIGRDEQHRRPDPERPGPPQNPAARAVPTAVSNRKTPVAANMTRSVSNRAGSCPRAAGSTCRCATLTALDAGQDIGDREPQRRRRTVEATSDVLGPGLHAQVQQREQPCSTTAVR